MCLKLSPAKSSPIFSAFTVKCGTVATSVMEQSILTSPWPALTRTSLWSGNTSRKTGPAINSGGHVIVHEATDKNDPKSRKDFYGFNLIELADRCVNLWSQFLKQNKLE